MGLGDYNKKRNFKTTTEPKGAKNNKNANIFVVQYHEARAKHYDFRLEYDGVLLSWAVPKGLSSNPKIKRLAVQVEDHPVDYASFEGVIPKGNYGAGTVEIFDRGNYMPLEDMKSGLKKGHIKIVLNGQKLKGGWSLVRIEANNWMAVKLKDEYASEKLIKQNNKLPFTKCNVQLATLSNSIPKGNDWIYEIKYDGYRMLVFKEGGRVTLNSRNNQDYTKKFQTLSSHIKNLEEQSFVLDGEVVAFDENGKSDFGLLQKNLKEGKGDFYYVAFDLLAIGADDLREEPLIKRKNRLERLLFKADNHLMYSKHVEDGGACFEFAKKHELEGVIAKKTHSKYLGKRNDDWLKIKCYLRQEFVVGGYTTSDKNDVLSSLLLGVYVEGKLRYVGKVGTGFSEHTKKELRAKFEKITTKTCPFEGKNAEKQAFWLKPKLIAEIQYTEFTKDGFLRQPSFIGLRLDKNAKDVVLETKL